MKSRILTTICVAALAVGTLTGCNNNENKQKEVKKAKKVEATKEADENYVAFLTDVGTIDDKSFNDGIWDGVKQFADKYNYKSEYFRPIKDTTEARCDVVDKAAEAGADIIVCAGSLFESAVYQKQSEYEDIEFLIIDGEPKDDKGNVDIKSNVHSILFKEEESGYMAGYVAVKEGYKKLGFLGGMKVKAVVYFGYGFVQGAEAAAKEENIKDIEINYYYSGTFQPSDEIRNTMKKWYQDGTETIFSCGGGILYSVIDAAGEDKERNIIGVDVDQSDESERIVFSAMKGLTTSVEAALEKYHKNNMKWQEDSAGKTLKVGVKENGVALSATKDSWRLKNVTLDEYEKIYKNMQKTKLDIKTDKLPKLKYVKLNKID